MKNLSRKMIAAVLLVSILAITLPRPARADIWGESLFAAMTFKELLEETYKKIQDGLVATLRIAAIRTIQGRLMALLGAGGMGGGPLIISDWRQFIYGSANQYSMRVTNDFFRSMSSGIPGPLAQRVVLPAQRAVMSDPFSVPPDLQNYVREGRADMIFRPGWAQNPWVAWRQAAMPQNDPGYMYMRGLALQQESFRQKEEEKKAEGVAGGGYQSKRAGEGQGQGKGSLDDGKITTPGSTIRDTSSKVLGMPIDMISMARNIPDIVAGMVTGMLAQMLNYGLIRVTSQIDRQIYQFQSGVTGYSGGFGGMPYGNMGNIQYMIQGGLR